MLRWSCHLCSRKAAREYHITLQADILDGFRLSIGLPSLRGRGYAHAAEDDQVRGRSNADCAHPSKNWPLPLCVYVVLMRLSSDLWAYMQE